ncbi:MAG TPA: GntR family transcriptional regulator [Acidimicrobiales bacterium]|nr:GntR family transcriptional regulator [Acidimicrobiales bacterium]
MTPPATSTDLPASTEPDSASDHFSSLPQVVMVHAYDHVYRLLRHAIVSRSLAPGTRAIEAALAERLRVSRTPIRDALRRLESDGLLIRTGNGSLEVVGLAPSEIDDIFRIRAELDRLVARMACKRGTADDWEEVRSRVQALTPVIERFGISSYEFSQAHEAVHAAIYRIAFAPVVARMLSERLLGLVEIAGELSYADDGLDEPVVAQHLELVDALASGSVKVAMAAADRHCREAEAAAQAVAPS